MHNAHLIEECRVELAFSSEDAALHGHERWASFIADRLLVVVGEVFDEVSVEGETRRFEHLYVDLGAAGPESSGTEIEGCVREQLLAAMERAMREPASGARAERGIARTVSELEQVRHFLSSGRLPWHGRQTRETDAVIRRVLQAHGPELAQWLRNPLRSPSVLLRLVRQFPASALEQVGTLLAPRDGAFLSRLARRLVSFFGAAAARTGGATPLMRTVWEVLIAEVLARDTARLDETALTRRAMARVARLLEERHGVSPAAVRLATAFLGSIPAADNVRAAVERAIIRGEVDALRARWRELVRDHGALLVEIVREHGVLAKVRRAMAERFPDPMLHDVVCLLEPGDGEFITELVHRPELFEARVIQPAPGPHQVRVRLWEFTLTYLLVERGGAFNKAAYVGSVVRQMAARDNLGYEQLLGAMTSVLENVGTRSALQVQMLELLHSLAPPAAAPQTPVPDVPASAETLVAAAGAYEAVAARLFSRRRYTGRESDALVADIQRLAAEYPSQLARLASTLQADPILGARVVSRLPAAALRALVLAAARVVHRGGDTAAAQFRNTLDAHALHARDPRRYLAQVLESVLSGKTLDLDVIALRAQGKTDAATDAHRPGVTGWDTVAVHRFCATLDDWLAGAPHTEIEPVWRALVRDNPRLLREALRMHVRSERAVSAIVRRSTDSMLCDIVYVLEPAHADFIDEIVHRRPVSPAQGQPAAASAEAFTRGMWDFTLSYLLVDRGGRFNKHSYLCSVVRRMAAHENLAADDLVRTLVAALQNVRVPNAIQLEMLELLRTLAADSAQPSHSRTGATAAAGKRGAVRLRPARHDEAVRLDTAQRLARAVRLDRSDRLAQAVRLDRWDRWGRAVRLESSDGFTQAVRLEKPVAIRTDAVASEDRAAPEGAAALAAIAGILNSPGATSATKHRTLARRIEREMRAPQALRCWLAGMLEDRRAIARLVAALPESLLLRVLALLRPSDYAAAWRCADLMSAAVLRRLPPGMRPRGASPRAERHAPGMRARNGPTPARAAAWKWQHIFGYLVAEGRPFDLRRFAREFLVFVSKRCRHLDLSRLHDLVVRHLRQAGIAADPHLATLIVEALSSEATARAADVERASAEALHDRFRLADDPSALTDATYVLNAGQVLAAPYVPRLFEMLKLTDAGKFVDERAAERAVHLLQFMVDGSTESPEHLLVLNKILCGVPLHRPIERDVGLTQHEKEAVEGMVRGMIQNWTALGTTSVAGLRESFLQREGRLQPKDDTWHLRVQPRAFDMLLDRIPWGFSTIRHSWMDRVVHVEWR